jgi:hypothetical protein
MRFEKDLKGFIGFRHQTKPQWSFFQTEPMGNHFPNRNPPIPD